jgi:hypothetical protein
MYKFLITFAVLINEPSFESIALIRWEIIKVLFVALFVSLPR